MTDLVEFLRARLDEDERIARACLDTQWHYSPSLPWNTERGERDAVVSWMGSSMSCVAITAPLHGDAAGEAVHIARHDPARVLREVQANRRTVELHGDQHECTDRRGSEYPYVGCETLRLRALPYADHPHYREEWRP